MTMPAKLKQRVRELFYRIKAYFSLFCAILLLCAVIPVFLVIAAAAAGTTYILKKCR